MPSFEKAIYLDNASTTALLPEVTDAMSEAMKRFYANPSSIHQAGHQAKALIEKYRRNLSDLFNCSPGSLFFTSGGTESNNWVIQSRVYNHGVDSVISSQLEHSSIREPLVYLKKKGAINLSWVGHNACGEIDLDDLEQLLLDQKSPSLLTLMHINNEIGNVNPIQKIAQLATNLGAWLHVDLVQSVGYYPLDFQQLKMQSAALSGHKVHGPKGVGLLYLAEGCPLKPLLWGGKQEREMRGGTEDFIGIVGLATALIEAHKQMAQSSKKIKQLKLYFIEQLKKWVPGVIFYGLSSDMEASHYKLIHVGLPAMYDKETLILQLSLQGIHLSSGSACSSGTAQQTHVLGQLGHPIDRAHIRIGLSRYNTAAEIDKTIRCLRQIGGL